MTTEKAKQERYDRDRAALDETIKLTVWRNIRRYVILAGISFVIIDLIITLTVVIFLAIDTRNSDKAHAQVACDETATLAHIQRQTVRAQQAQTQALVKQGFTFGIPPKQFDKLLRQSNKQTARELRQLDSLANANCKDLTPPNLTPPKL